MPSNSYINFLHMRIDVLRLTKTHYDFSQNARGRKYLGHLTRSAVIMLCAAWERYNEDLLLEAIEFLSNSVTDPHLLNKRIKQIISAKVKADKNEIKPIELAGDGWKTIWIEYAKMETELLNTPKIEQLRTLFVNYLGILDYTRLWNIKNPRLINDFVATRGDIAHRGSQAAYVQMRQLRKYQDLIIETVINIDSNMSDELRNMSGRPGLPWIKDYSKNIDYYRGNYGR